MTDIYSKTKRSEIMSKISGKNTKPEILVRKYLFAQGFRYRKNVKYLPGKPDIVLPKYHTIIFVHGCFWHGHLCKRGSLPETNHEFWQEKIRKNKERDDQITNELKNKGWRVIVIWQCEISNIEFRTKKLSQLVIDLLRS